MTNELLLAKSNLRKKKGISIGISLLMFIASLLISLSLLLFVDAYPNTERYANKLNAGNGNVVAYNSLNNIDNALIDSIIKDDVTSYEIHDYLFFVANSVHYGQGEMSINLLLTNSDGFNKTMNRTEIVEENNKYTSSYVYIPYQFHTAGGYSIGDGFTLNVKDKSFNFTVRGYINNTVYGCTNSGSIEFIADDVSFAEIKNYSDVSNYAKTIIFQTKDTITPRKLGIKISNSLTAVNPQTVATSGDIDSVVANRGFMSLILAVSFITVTSILCLIIVLMLTNCISNYVKESMKEIGALKAMGYTSKNIIASIIIQFIILAVVSAISGIAISYISMPAVSRMVTAQQGLPYTVSFNAISTFVPLLFTVLFTGLVVFLATRKIKKIEPIIALREGLENHNFKKNRVPLESSKMNLNLSLSFKTLLTNIKQNIITFIVTGFLTFVSVIGLLMFENFGRNPMVEILTFETFSGLVSVDKTVKDDAYQYLTTRDDIHNVKRMINYMFTYGDNDDELLVNIIDDISKFNNVNVCYKGNLPKYDNEIAISGKFANIYNYTIGDSIELSVSNKKASYLICGFLQSCNNNGREAIITEKAAESILDLNEVPGYFWFDCEKEKVNPIINDVKDKYGDKFISSLNFDEIIDGSMTSFRIIATLMLVIISGVSIVVILLVLYLLIKSLIHNKKKEFGVLKAVGYKNKDLILQTALSFMPSIILSSIIFSFISYFSANSYMNMIMINFGLVKCSFVIPVVGVVIVAVSLCAISFLFSILESRKIKKIEPYNLLIAE